MAGPGPGLDTRPGFRRRIEVLPGPSRITAALEDDYHCMAVTLRHDGGTVTEVVPVMERAPWTTCPGAPAKLKATFEGVALSGVAVRGEKQANCTHLHDLAVLAAAHAHDAAPTRYDILVADARDGRNEAEIRRDGRMIVRLVHEADILVEPEEVRGVSLFKLRPWIEAQDAPTREAARLLQWGTILAHGRAMPIEKQSDARRMPPNCYTFQPENAKVAVRIGRVVDFSAEGAPEPLERLDGPGFRAASALSMDE